MASGVAHSPRRRCTRAVAPSFLVGACHAAVVGPGLQRSPSRAISRHLSPQPPASENQGSRRRRPGAAATWKNSKLKTTEASKVGVGAGREVKRNVQPNENRREETKNEKGEKRGKEEGDREDRQKNEKNERKEEKEEDFVSLAPLPRDFGFRPAATKATSPRKPQAKATTSCCDRAACAETKRLDAKNTEASPKRLPNEASTTLRGRGGSPIPIFVADGSSEMSVRNEATRFNGSQREQRNLVD